jgi:hypothetical protein
LTHPVTPDNQIYSKVESDSDLWHVKSRHKSENNLKDVFMRVISLGELETRTPRERLEFVVYLANFEATNTEREYEVLRRRFDRFFAVASKPSRDRIIFLPGDDPANYSRQRLADLQKELWAILFAVTAKKFRAEDGSFSPFIKVAMAYSIINVGADLSFPAVTGPARDLFLQATIMLLLNHPGLVQLCPECENKYFVKVRRQRYCSRKCVDIANHRAWFKTRKGKKYLRELKKRRYGNK